VISGDVLRPTLVVLQEGGPVYGIVQSFHGLVIRFQILFFLFMTIEASHIRHFSADFYRQSILPVESCMAQACFGASGPRSSS